MHLEALTEAVNAQLAQNLPVRVLQVRDHLVREAHGAPPVPTAAAHAKLILSALKKKVLITTANGVIRVNQVPQEIAAREDLLAAVRVHLVPVLVVLVETQFIRREREVQPCAAQEERPKKTNNNKNRGGSRTSSANKNEGYPDFRINSGFFLLGV